MDLQSNASFKIYISTNTKFYNESNIIKLREIFLPLITIIFLSEGLKKLFLYKTISIYA